MRYARLRAIVEVALEDLADGLLRTMRGRRGLAVATIVAGLAFVAAAGTLAFWNTSGLGAANAGVGMLTTPPQPTVYSPKGTATVEVAWPPGSTLKDGTTPVQGYYVTRSNGSTTSPACGTSPTSLATSTSCVDSAVPNGTYTYRVIAVWRSFSATSAASESVVVAIGGGTLANPVWASSKAQAGATGAAYTYGFSTATAAELTSVTMTVPPGTAGTPTVGTASGLAGGTVSLSENTLTYSVKEPKWVNAGTAASIQITGLTNTPNASSYTSQITTRGTASGGPSVPLDNGITAAIAFTGGTLANSVWTTSKSQAGATGAAYAYGFKTASAATLTSVTMTVPPGTAGTPALGTVSGLPGGGKVSLSNNTLTYAFSATSIGAGTAVSIQITGLTNTSNVSSYTSQITTNNETVPIDSATTAAISFTGGTLANPVWASSKAQAGATGAAYTYGFSTATAAELTSVTMTVPPGTAGTPTVGTVSGLAGGTVSLSENTLTYSVKEPKWVNAGTAASIQITGLTNTSALGSYSSQITTNGSNVAGPSVPLDSGITAAVSFTGGTLANSVWTTSKSQAGATGAAYAYGFTTATTSTLTSVTMSVPPGTSGTPTVGAVSGLPTGGTVSLSSNLLTYAFSATKVPAGTAVSIQVKGLTNTSASGSYTAQITTNNEAVPIDNGITAAVAFTSGSLANPVWASSKAQAGATGAAYTYGFSTATGAALTSVTMTVPPGTAGTTAVATVSGLPAGTVSLSENTLTYSINKTEWINAGTAVSIQVTGLTNTSTSGSYTGQITTNGSSVNGPSIPLDSGITAPVAFAGGTLSNAGWTSSKSNVGASEATYTYSFSTATAGSLTSVTMSVPSGTTGIPTLGAVSGLPAPGGTVSLSGNLLTYSLKEAESISAGTPISIQVKGLTNTSTPGTYSSQITTYTGAGPLDSAITAGFTITGGALANPIWTSSKSQVGASEANYTYSFATATAGALTSVTMSVPSGTAGTPTLGTVSGLPAPGGTVSLSGNLLTYSISKAEWVNGGSAVSIQVKGLTNTSTPGSYSSQITTNNATGPLDSAVTAPVALTGTLAGPAWTTSRSQAGASEAAYTYEFKTAAAATLNSVTMTVPPGTAGIPAVGTVSGLPSGGTVSLSENTLTYAFSGTRVGSGTAVSIQVKGLTNSSTSGSYTSQITTNNATGPIDSATTGSVTLVGTVAGPTWTTSKPQVGATEATYTYGFTTATTGSLTSVTMSVPSGTAGAPVLGTVSGVPSGGKVSLSENMLTYAFSAAEVKAGTVILIPVKGLTNTSTPGSYTSQITTDNPTGPIDNGTTPGVAFTGTLAGPTWTTSKSEAGATEATYTYGFTTATTGSLTSVTMSVPSGTAGTPVLGTVSGVPTGGTVSLSGNLLTYAFSATKVNSGTAASIQVKGLTNTSTVGSYSSQITTNSATGPNDNATTAAVAFTGALSSPVWTTSNAKVKAEATYTYGFTTATTGSLTSVTMSLPSGTEGTPTLGTVTGVGTGTISRSGTTLTYSIKEAKSISAGTVVSIQVKGLTNTLTPGSYTSQVTTYSGTGPSVPLDTATTSTVPITTLALASPTWATTSKVKGAAATYTYGFKTATTGLLTSVTMTVPPGTTGTPTLGTISGVPSGGKVSLVGNLLTYAFSATEVKVNVTASIQIKGLTNTSTAGTYTSQITTYLATGPLDSAITAGIEIK